MLGKTLRGDQNRPSYCAMVFALSNNENLPNRRGRPKINLMDEIKKELERRHITMKSPDDLRRLREIAGNEKICLVYGETG